MLKYQGKYAICLKIMENLIPQLINILKYKALRKGAF